MNRYSMMAAIAAAAALIGSASAQEPRAFRPVSVNAEPAPFAQVQGVWAADETVCAEAPWQITGDAFTTGAIGATCSFDAEAQSAAVNRSGLVTTFHTPASCTFGEEASDWNFYFMLSADAQLLWVSASNGLERTLVRCPAEAAAEGDGEESEAE